MNDTYLDIQNAGGRRQLIVRPTEPLTIGRHSDNKLVLNDSKVSRFHCVVERSRGGQYVLRDLGASNGTKVNGRLIKAAALSPGDTITVGDTTLVLVLPAAEAPPPRETGLLAEASDAMGMGLMAEGEFGLAAADDEEEIEELSDADLVDDGSVPYSSLAPSEAPPAPAVQADINDFETTLWSMAEMVPDKPFGEIDIALLNARGQVVHAAGKPLPHGPRQAADVLRLILLVCFRGRATDIHLEPRDQSYHARIRVDGVMVDAADFPQAMSQRLIGVVKVLCDIDLSQRNIIQEGHFSARVPAVAGQASGAGGPMRRVDYRVSFAPSVSGPKLVIRILDAATAPTRLPDLGLPESAVQELTAAIEQDTGMVLVCGPTGSGKTSTLYALVRTIDTRERNVVTIENPVEIRIDDATQISVDEEQGNTFAALLKSVLRQDPDVILVGEIRDAETARTAMQASITGHLVFSTVHTKDAPGTIYRLMDLGIEGYLLAEGLQMVIAQRLVRQLCPFCRLPRPATPEQLARMKKAGVTDEVTHVHVPIGCGRCMGTGFAGRVAVFELLRVTEAVRHAISGDHTPAGLQKALDGENFTSLATMGFRMVAEGRVAFDEIDKAVGR